MYLFLMYLYYSRLSVFNVIFFRASFICSESKKLVSSVYMTRFFFLFVTYPINILMVSY